MRKLIVSFIAMSILVLPLCAVTFEDVLKQTIGRTSLTANFNWALTEKTQIRDMMTTQGTYFNLYQKDDSADLMLFSVGVNGLYANGQKPIFGPAVLGNAKKVLNKLPALNLDGIADEIGVFYIYDYDNERHLLGLTIVPVDFGVFFKD